MATRIGVDIGGTFTDLVWFDEATGKTLEGKVPTVPAAPEEGVVDAIAKHVPPEVIAQASFFLHGTTVGLNALLERRGSKIALITTEGFRDVLEIRRGDRDEMYNLFWRQPEPLVSRRLRLEVRERIMATGAVRAPLDRASVLRAWAALKDENLDSIAVCLINAYANPAHELEVEEILREAGFTGGLSLSHRISGEYREYERTSTTAIDAFVRGRMSNYLRRLESRLRDLGFTGTALITRSGGGSMTFAEAEKRPFETIMSGPVGGAQGAAEVARMLGIDSLIGADVGGTSFDTTLILDGAPQLLFEGAVDNMPVQSPWVDVRSIGSGGGSLAYVDAGGLMRVGPQSAGAVPGPACYGKGGVKPTTTDAAAWLGMLGTGEFDSGIRLDIPRAETALATVAAQLGTDVEEVAAGILRIATAAMANTMREISIDQGLDPRDMTLLAFGGAGPLMGVLLAAELDITRVVVPLLAGNFSAWGLLGADLMQASAQTRIMDFVEAAMPAVGGVYDGLLAGLGAREADVADAETVCTCRLDLRYKGQEHTLSVEVPVADERICAEHGAILETFREEYVRTFGATMSEDVELVSTRVGRRTPLPRREAVFTPPTVADDAGGTIDAWSFAQARRMPFRLVRRDGIVGTMAGPAIVTEPTTTTYIDAGWSFHVGSHGELTLIRGDLA